MFIIRHALSLFKKIFSYHCVLCGQASDHEQDLCEPCRKALPILAHTCKRCANPAISETLCHHCSRETPPFNHTIALFSYTYPITHLILTLKFNQALIYGKVLGQLLAEKIAETYHSLALPDVIIAVPLHSKRLTERGFNQALEIARPVSKQLGIPLDIDHCKRIKSTKAQAKLSALERETNLRQAFRVTEDFFSGKSVAILDDVITTGHTVKELAFTLKQAGAKQIDVWCVAKAITRVIL